MNNLKSTRCGGEAKEKEEMKKLKIERPDWAMISDGEICAYGIRHLDKWFDSEIEPLNKILEGAQTVYADEEHSDIWSIQNTMFDKNTHKALLIKIEPIKQWQCPCGEIAMFADTEDCRTPLCHGCAMEIKLALENEGE